MAETFNYAEHNVCGGPSHRVVSQGPKRSICVGTTWVNLNPPPAKLPKVVPPEGHYVSKEKGTMSAVDFKQNLRFLRQCQAKVAVVSESTEEWLCRHKIGEYGTKT
jgi:hypothetical protein